MNIYFQREYVGLGEVQRFQVQFSPSSLYSTTSTNATSTESPRQNPDIVATKKNTTTAARSIKPTTVDPADHPTASNNDASRGHGPLINCPSPTVASENANPPAEEEIVQSPPPSPALKVAKAPAIWIRVKNKEARYRTAAYFQGPFTLCVSIWNDAFPLGSKAFLRFEPNLLPSTSMWVCVPGAAFDNEMPVFIEIASQAIFRKIDISFELAIGLSEESIRAFSAAEVDKIEAFPNLHVQHWQPADLWRISDRLLHTTSSHLVVLTHGMHANLTADMLYLNESIKQAAQAVDEPVVVRGFSGNTCETEKGVRYLGARLGKWLLDIVGWKSSSFPRYSHISLVGHSLGGLIQTFAAGYVHAHTKGQFFKVIHPVHFVTLATPWLGESGEHPSYVGRILSYGVIGKTGQDLSLMHTSHKVDPRPLLLLMSDPASPFYQALSFFKHRSLYANTANDYVVPFGTSAMEPHSLGQRTQYMRDNALQSVVTEEPKSTQQSASSGTSFLSTFRSLKAFFLPQSKAQVPQGVEPSQPENVPINLKEEHASNFVSSETFTAEFLQTTNVSNNAATKLLQTVNSLLLPPVPTSDFFLDCHLRNVILHDQLHPAKSLSIAFEDSQSNDQFLKDEHSISRNWSTLSWRKVFVRLDGDAHNSLIVRRRFPNAYGWAAVDHLTKLLFPQNNMDTYGSTWPEIDETTTAVWLSELYDDDKI
ncbi:lipase [Schizosaccharomyces japonicus yFS275]|uniref:Lipase n=1 Tax=Schizosaccharomyces japonicus (strain yFS275 / FY16936) TaxID=402676 RepID=B6K893_SCHJY|nr:lipase [Schizosaccharomyces japonicus yFS275]EEB09747.1 lipase [Schizosaccharomyces japonicus yFS275]